MNRREVTKLLATGVLSFGLAGRKWFWKPEAPPQLKRLERYECGSWCSVKFDSIKSGDQSRVVGEPSFIFVARSDAYFDDSDATKHFINVDKLMLAYGGAHGE